MPPKRTKRKVAAQSQPPPPAAPSRESEIAEAYHLFALPRSTLLAQAEDDDDQEVAEQLDEYSSEETLLKVLDVRRTLKSLNLPPPPGDFFDTSQRFVTQTEFVELAQTLAEMNDDGDADEQMNDAPGEAKAGKGKGKAKQKPTREEREKAEIDHAFALFTTPIPASGGFEPQVQAGRRITLSDLKRVARELREEVDENVLKMVVLEANGAEGDRGVTEGVGREEFENVMKRAGVFG